ncbi:hypothetical protein RRG08_034815 [Elysia crispata]|uniref:Uncharacterized protein n=1 Tax=Elysia crispata TaxID=231223 RepID=A0AAE1ANB1_9GAST|nr:hypothetical protein RRG08_034815 [Elysia crispata]
MDRSKSRSDKRHTASSSEDQACDETYAKSWASNEERPSQWQSTFNIIKGKTSTGLNKLRGSLSAWRREENSVFREGAGSEVGEIEPSTNKNTTVSYSEESTHGKQISEQNEISKDWGLGFDHQALHDFQGTSQTINKSMSINKEPHRGPQSESPMTTLTEMQTPVSLKTAHWVLGKHRMAPQEPTQGPKPICIPPSPVSRHLGEEPKDVVTIQQPVSPLSPSVPPRHRNDSYTNVTDIQQTVSGQQVLNQSETIATNLLAREAEFSNRNLTKASPTEKVTLARVDVMYSKVHYTDFNTGLQNIKEGPIAGIKRDRTNYHPSTCYAQHPAQCATPMSHTCEAREGDEEERPQDDAVSTHPTKDKHGPKSPFSFHTDHVGRDPCSPPIISVHNVNIVAEPLQRRVFESAPPVARSGAASTLSHHITPNRPAPKPPTVRSTVAQYPGPLKGYTVSAARGTEAYPPPLPPPPPPRNLTPSAPPPPPRYMYYDTNEPRPYMPTTEPLPHKTEGASFLNNLRGGWKDSLFSTRKAGPTSEQPDAASGPGSFVFTVPWMSSMFRHPTSRQFSNLSTSTGSIDSPTPPVDPKRSSKVWIFSSSKTRSEECVDDTARGKHKDNVAERLFGKDIYKFCLVEMACCCCWPIGLASRILSSTMLQGRRRPSEMVIHTMAQQQSWYALLLGISFYFFFLVFTLSLLTVRARSS